jgi:transcriptional regulator with XRE-family HTH domain
MTSSDSLGTLLEAARVRRGLTLIGLSRATGIPLTTLHRLFHDKVTRPSPVQLANLARKLDVAREALFTAAGYPAPEVHRAAASPDDLNAALRAAYPGMPDEAITQMRAAVEAVAAEHAGGAR